MWTLRFLNGSQKGQTASLSSGSHTLGRSSSCSIKITAPGISKIHAKIEIKEDKIILSDNNSKNGTYVNGVQITRQEIEMGDQVALHNIIFDITRPQGFQAQESTPSNEEADTSKQNLAQKWENYLNKVVLPGVYKIPEWIEFKWVIGLFSIGFILIVTLLSSFPLTQILKNSVERESLYHAESIAQALARENQAAIKDGIHTAVRVDFAQRRPGVKEAMIINASDGRIISPIEKIHTYPKNPFVHSGRKTGQKLVKKIDSSTVGAMHPIQFFNPETSSQSVAAYSVVLYNMGALSVESGQTLSLIVQTLFIALIMGTLIFFLMYRMIIHPFESANEQLESALKDNTKNISIPYQFPALNRLCDNMNNVLERLNTIQEQSRAATHQVDRQHEMLNLVELVGFACLCIRMDTLSISAVNSVFEQQTGIASDQILHQNIEKIDDVPLQLQLKAVVEKSSADPSNIHSDQLEFGGTPFQINSQGVHGVDSLAYVLVAFIPEEEAG